MTTKLNWTKDGSDLTSDWGNFRIALREDRHRDLFRQGVKVNESRLSLAKAKELAQRFPNEQRPDSEFAAVRDEIDRADQHREGSSSVTGSAIDGSDYETVEMLPEPSVGDVVIGSTVEPLVKPSLQGPDEPEMVEITVGVLRGSQIVEYNGIPLGQTLPYAPTAESRTKASAKPAAKEADLMPAQYREAKERFPDALLLVKTVDHWTAMFEDAVTVGEVLKQKLTKRGKAIVTLDHFDSAVRKLLKAGHKVAVCNPDKVDSAFTYEPEEPAKTAAKEGPPSPDVPEKAPEPSPEGETPAEAKPGASTGILEWATEPVSEEWATAKVLRWHTACDRYRVTRVASTLREEPVYFGTEWKRRGVWDSTDADRTQGAGYPMHHRNLNAAMEAAERFHCTKAGVETVESNREAVVARAAANEVTHQSPHPDNVPEQTEETEKVMRVKEADARRMLVNMGSPKAADADAKKLQHKINKLPETTDTLEAPKGDDKVLFNRVCKALEEGISVEVIPEGQASEPAKAKGGKGKDGLGPVPSATKAKGKAHEGNGHAGKNGGGGKEKDRFGNREGTSAATINATLKGVMSIDDIVKASGQTAERVKSHVSGLRSRGFLERTGDGYKVTLTK